MKKALLRILKSPKFPYIAVMILGALALFIQMYFTVYYADDFSVGSVEINSVGALFKKAVDHYYGWGGGYTETFIIVLMKLHPIAWKLFITALMTLFVSMSSRIIAKDNHKKRAFAAIIEWLLFFGASIWLSREVVYWQDGAVAYLLTTVQALLAFYFVYTRLYMGDKKFYDVFLIPFVCFFGGWSSAQSGAISAFIVLALVLYKQFVKKEKVKARYWVYAAITIIGFAIFYFAPGNYNRMDIGFQHYLQYGFFGRILYRIGDVFSLLFDGGRADVMLLPFFMYFAFALIAAYAFEKAKSFRDKKTRRISNVCSALAGLFVIGFAISRLPIPQLDTFSHFAYYYPNLKFIPLFSLKFFAALVPFIMATVAIIATLVNTWLITFKTEKNKDPLLLAFLLTSLAAQFALVLSPVSPYRTLIYCAFFAICVDAYLLTKFWEEKIRVLPLAIIMISLICIELALLLAVLYFIATSYIKAKEGNLYRFDIVIFLFCFALYAGGNYCRILTAMHANKTAYDENVSRIIAFRDSDPDCEESCVLYLLPPVEPDYSVSWFIGEDWVEESIRAYFDLPEKTILKYEPTMVEEEVE